VTDSLTAPHLTSPPWGEEEKPLIQPLLLICYAIALGKEEEKPLTQPLLLVCYAIALEKEEEKPLTQPLLLVCYAIALDAEEEKPLSQTLQYAARSLPGRGDAWNCPKNAMTHGGDPLCRPHLHIWCLLDNKVLF
jgi:hypothetical protein